MSKEQVEIEKKYCHFIINCNDITEPPQSSDIQTAFVRGSVEEKKENLKLLIKMIASDDNFPRLIMPVLTNLQQTSDHELKKMLFLYWEVIEKTNVDGTLKEELILACNAFRKDLLSPNEFIRGRTLRMVSKITVKSILENLMEAIAQNLEHRHFYVRRNAIMSLYNIYQTTGIELIEDFIDTIEKLCINESDLSTKRNSFILLFHVDQNRALTYLKQLIAQSEDDPIYEMGDIFQLSVLEMLRRLCKSEPTQKSRLMNAIFMLSNSKSSSVLLECANTIIQLTTAPSAVKIAVQSYLSLMQDQNDNNVKLIVLNKIVELKKLYSKILEEYMSDILNIIREDSVQSIEINQKVLELVTDLVNQRNVQEVGVFLNKEITKAKKLPEGKGAQDKDEKEKREEQGSSELAGIPSTNEYRYLLIKSVSKITHIYPDTVPQMIDPLMDSFLMFEKKGSKASLETIVFIREVVETYPQHRNTILSKLNALLSSIKNHMVLRVAIWIIGEYSATQPQLDDAFEAIKQNVGTLPLHQQEPEDTKQLQIEDEQKPKVITKTIILPDGSYGTETIVVDDASRKDQAQDDQEQLPLRKALKNADDDFLASCVSITLAKLAVKSKKNLNVKKFNQISVEASLIICALLKGQKKYTDANNNQRMQMCLKILTNPNLLRSVNGVLKILADQGRRIYQKSLEGSSRILKDQKDKDEQKLIITQPDETIMFRQLKGRAAITDFDITEEIAGALGGETHGYEEFLGEIKKDIDSKVYQLTGFSDPVYAEAFVEVHHYDILLKIVLMNRTNKTLPNISFEFLTQGNLKVVEKPIPITLRAESSATIKASLKVSSTDNGVVYGYITYDSSSGNQPNILNINEIQIDFINDLMQAECSDYEFKKKWAEYEWENKVQVNTTMTDLHQFVDHFAKSLNVSLMTKLDEHDRQASNNFLVANLYTKSKFEEDCLLNMSIEKVNFTPQREGPQAAKQDVKITGLIRLRAKTEGMALCVGEKCKLVR